ncbi:MAG: AmmeMemoRadiSam system protein A [Gammaproteobacteria bacterium]|nr:AmmeMemoRadiSam system protein A [Gammaproteobacteria bacterium]
MKSDNETYSAAQRNTLLQLAAKSIEHGLQCGTPLNVNTAQYPPPLQEQRATFVTLSINKKLRGCIGGLVATRPLVDDIAHHAYSSAFEDPRFAALRPVEFQQLDIHIAVLTPAEALCFTNEDELIKQIRPNVDGLILSEGEQRSTFLPSVWESLPKTEDFLRHLKQKAGLPENYWSTTLKVERYTTESFGREVSKLLRHR